MDDDGDDELRGSHSGGDYWNQTGLRRTDNMKMRLRFCPRNPKSKKRSIRRLGKATLNIF
jgi:hypothetical protein